MKRILIALLVATFTLSAFAKDCSVVIYSFDYKIKQSTKDYVKKKLQKKGYHVLAFAEEIENSSVQSDLTVILATGGLFNYTSIKLTKLGTDLEYQYGRDTYMGGRNLTYRQKIRKLPTCPQVKKDYPNYL